MSLIENFVQNHVDLLKRNDYIDPSLYKEYGVKSGLRNEDGKGVLAGLTNISQIISENIVDGKKQPCDGELWYRGHRINGLIEDLGDELGFEKIWRPWRPELLPKPGIFRNRPIPTSIFTAAPSIICSMCRRHSLLRFLPSRVSSAGQHTGWKS